MEHDRPEVPDVTERIPNLIRRPFLDAAHGPGIPLPQLPAPSWPVRIHKHLLICQWSRAGLTPSPEERGEAETRGAAQSSFGGGIRSGPGRGSPLAPPPFRTRASRTTPLPAG